MTPFQIFQHSPSTPVCQEQVLDEPHGIDISYWGPWGNAGGPSEREWCSYWDTKGPSVRSVTAGWYNWQLSFVLWGSHKVHYYYFLL